MWQVKTLLAGIAFTFLLPASSFASDLVKVAFPSISAILWPMWAARDQGFYSSEGIQVELIQVRLGSATIAQALLSGGLSFASTGLPVAITSRLAGAETVIVGASSNTVEFQVYGGKGITSFDGLRGKTVASGSKGSGGEIGMMATLQYAGLVPGKDLNVIYIGNSNDRLTALRTDLVQATILSPPLTRVARLDGFTRLLTVSNILTDWVGNGYFTSKRLVQQNPGLVERFLRSSLKGTRFLKTERKKAIEIGMRYWKAPEAEVAEYYDDIVRNLEDWGEINTTGLSRAIALIAKQRNQPPPQVHDFIDVRFINAIKQARK
jgi:ABC-type nitrate/sulfonate/bicarbonate transport system substrate-binding protein